MARMAGIEGEALEQTLTTNPRDLVERAKERMA